MTKTQAATEPKPELAAAKPQSQLAIVKRDVVDVVGERVSALVAAGELHMPAHYSPENAMKQAWLALQEATTADNKPVLSACRPDSIANALLDMVVQGLSPAKKQCYFIAYGSRLTLQRSYFGTMALLKRAYGAGVDVLAEVVYKGDTFTYAIEGGRKRVVEHIQSIDNVAVGEVVAAYCVVDFGAGNERPPYTEIMTATEIRAAWAQGQTKGGSPAHKKFDAEMSKKTVINRACKRLINSSDDHYLVRAVQRNEVANELVEEAAAGDERPDPEQVDLPDYDSAPASRGEDNPPIDVTPMGATEPEYAEDDIPTLFTDDSRRAPFDR